MTDYETFSTKRAASARIREMQGWDARATQLYLPDDANADAEGNVWVIDCGDGNFLRSDGYVR